jgi:hypothetical protein
MSVHLSWHVTCQCQYHSPEQSQHGTQCDFVDQHHRLNLHNVRVRPQLSLCCITQRHTQLCMHQQDLAGYVNAQLFLKAGAIMRIGWHRELTMSIVVWL